MRSFALVFAALLIAACVTDAATVSKRKFTFAHKAVAEGKQRVKRDGGNRTALGVFADYDYLILALQKCYDDSAWTIHGLWPSDYGSRGPSYCSSDSFSTSAVSSIWSYLQQYWPSCAWSGTSQTDFLSHEWQKHGTCFGAGELTYFSDALEIFQDGGWRSQCSDSSNTCQVTVQAPSV